MCVREWVSLERCAPTLSLYTVLLVSVSRSPFYLRTRHIFLTRVLLSYSPIFRKMFKICVFN